MRACIDSSLHIPASDPNIEPVPFAENHRPVPRNHRSATRLSGLVERITFRNEETGFGVLRVRSPDHDELVAIIGPVAIASTGEFVIADGVWKRDRNHGFQFQAETIATSRPTTPEGIELYLGSGIIRGIGPVWARRLV
jgi:exodeoxyribonuclease V alpha subunit